MVSCMTALDQVAAAPRALPTQTTANGTPEPPKGSRGAGSSVVRNDVAVGAEQAGNPDCSPCATKKKRQWFKRFRPSKRLANKARKLKSKVKLFCKSLVSKHSKEPAAPVVAAEDTAQPNQELAVVVKPLPAFTSMVALNNYLPFTVLKSSLTLIAELPLVKFGTDAENDGHDTDSDNDTIEEIYSPGYLKQVAMDILIDAAKSAAPANVTLTRTRHQFTPLYFLSMMSVTAIIPGYRRLIPYWTRTKPTDFTTTLTVARSYRPKLRPSSCYVVRQFVPIVPKTPVVWTTPKASYVDYVLSHLQKWSPEPRLPLLPWSDVVSCPFVSHPPLLECPVPTNTTVPSDEVTEEPTEETTNVLTKADESDDAVLIPSMIAQVDDVPLVLPASENVITKTHGCHWQLVAEESVDESPDDSPLVSVSPESDDVASDGSDDFQFVFAHPEVGTGADDNAEDIEKELALEFVCDFEKELVENEGEWAILEEFELDFPRLQGFHKFNEAYLIPADTTMDPQEVHSKVEFADFNNFVEFEKDDAPEEILFGSDSESFEVQPLKSCLKTTNLKRSPVVSAKVVKPKFNAMWYHRLANKFREAAIIRSSPDDDEYLGDIENFIYVAQLTFPQLTEAVVDAKAKYLHDFVELCEQTVLVLGEARSMAMAIANRYQVVVGCRSDAKTMRGLIENRRALREERNHLSRMLQKVKCAEMQTRNLRQRMPSALARYNSDSQVGVVTVRKIMNDYRNMLDKMKGLYTQCTVEELDDLCAKSHYDSWCGDFETEYAQDAKNAMECNVESLEQGIRALMRLGDSMGEVMEDLYRYVSRDISRCHHRNR